MNILAINFNHDGAAALLKEGKLAGFVNTERFSRKKKHPGLREEDLVNLLDQVQIKIQDIDLVVLVNLNNIDSLEIPQIFGTNLKETWVDFWINGPGDKIRLLGHTIDCVVERRHHIFHASAAYYFSPFQSAIVFSCDPTGMAAFVGKKNKIIRVPLSWNFNAGRLYSIVAAQIFENGLHGAGKLMGLAPYGSSNLSKAECKKMLRTKNEHEVCNILLELSQKKPILFNDGDHAWNATLAAHAQKLLETNLDLILEQLSSICEKEGVELNLCLTGGTALNSVANQVCFERSEFKNIYMHPACGDDGTAIGAALFYWHHLNGNPKIKRTNREAMYSIRSYSEKEINKAISEVDAQVKVERTSDYIRKTAEMLTQGKIVGWFQGSSEIGPRALGNRSLVCDPRKASMVAHLNKNVKKREGFRPFAPSVMSEHAEAWFGFADNPFMLRVAKISKDSAPAITHVDGSARFQSVSKDDNPNYHKLISSFYEMTGVPLVLNTSFNVRSEPIVETPADALKSLLTSEIDAVVFPNVIVAKK